MVTSRRHRGRLSGSPGFQEAGFWDSSTHRHLQLLNIRACFGAFVLKTSASKAIRSSYRYDVQPLTQLRLSKPSMSFKSMSLFRGLGLKSGERD